MEDYMTVNVENIDKMIAAISAQPTPIQMGDWVVKNGESECGTTACLAGWANLLRLDQLGKGLRDDWKFDNTAAAGEWMGITPSYGYHLFFSTGADLLKPELRKAAAIELLTKIRNGEEPRWNDVLDQYRGEDGYIKAEFSRY
jgi:hypothetical protein